MTLDEILKSLDSEDTASISGNPAIQTAAYTINPLLGAAVSAVSLGSSIVARRKAREERKREERNARTRAEMEIVGGQLAAKDYAQAQIYGAGQTLARSGRVGGPAITGMGNVMGQVYSTLSAQLPQIRSDAYARMDERLREIKTDYLGGIEGRKKGDAASLNELLSFVSRFLPQGGGMPGVM